MYSYKADLEISKWIKYIYNLKKFYSIKNFSLLKFY